MRIDVFHDIACPWCRIGKVHLAEALAQWGQAVEVHYHPFLLNATIPDEGADFEIYMLAKGNHQVALEQFFAAPREMGQQIGITFNFEAITKAPNTINAHRLISFTEDAAQSTMIDALYTAYFEDGRDVGDIDVLVDIATRFGFERETIRERLLTDENRASVISQMAQAQQLGVTGVPFFVFNNLMAFSGAQPPASILQVLRQTQNGGIS